MNKFKFNVLDISIISIIIIALVAGGLYYLKSRSSEKVVADKKTIEFDVEAVDLLKEVADSFKIGANVVYGVTNTDAGVITNVKVEPYVKLMKDTENGKFIWTKYADRYKATITVKADVKESAESFKGNNEEVRIGVKMPIRGKGFAAANGFVVGLR